MISLQTGRLTDKQAGRQGERHTGRQFDTHTYRRAGTHTHTHTNKQTHTHTLCVLVCSTHAVASSTRGNSQLTDVMTEATAVEQVLKPFLDLEVYLMSEGSVFETSYAQLSWMAVTPAVTFKVRSNSGGNGVLFALGFVAMSASFFMIPCSWVLIDCWFSLSPSSYSGCPDPTAHHHEDSPLSPHEHGKPHS